MFKYFFSKNLIFLLLIVLVLFLSSLFLFFRVNDETSNDEQIGDEVLKVLFVMEQDGIPISTNIIAFYLKTKRLIMFDVPNNTGMILDELGRTDGISALYKEKGIEAFKKKIERLTGVGISAYGRYAWRYFAFYTYTSRCNI